MTSPVTDAFCIRLPWFLQQLTQRRQGSSDPWTPTGGNKVVTRCVWVTWTGSMAPGSTPIKRASGHTDKPREVETRRAFPRDKEASVRKPPVVGTITGAFDGVLDGVQARLIRTTKGGYTVELLESKDAFHKGDHVALSLAEFTITTRKSGHGSTAM
jgi:hypothetical protein